jgi:hypothetical protein
MASGQIINHIITGTIIWDVEAAEQANRMAVRAMAVAAQVDVTE